MNIKRIALFLGVVLLGCFAVYYFFKQDEFDAALKVRDFVYDKDAQAVDALFHKQDNWYWLISTESTHSYSVDFMLRHKTSSQSSKKNDMIIKVGVVGHKIAGFLAYYPKSNHVWQLLFLAVDQDFRRQGIARKLLNFAVQDMQRLGAYRVDLATRNNNFKAQSLYKSYGFVLVDPSDDDFVHFSWYKPNTIK